MEDDDLYGDLFTHPGPVEETVGVLNVVPQAAEPSMAKIFHEHDLKQVGYLNDTGHGPCMRAVLAR